jgi:geranylgeranyl diphosphate synthase, type I
MTTMDALAAADVLASSRSLVEPALRTAVATLPESMARVAGYHLGWSDPAGRPLDGDGSGSGKALRPALALSAAKAVGGEPALAVPAAVAVELVHNFSLLHDDVMDGDTSRRHRPTAWTVFGSSPAILAGNALLILAFEAVADDAAAVRVLAAAVQELLEGQSADLSFERRNDVTLAECRRMAVAKTGALLGCACALGGLAVRPDADDGAHLTTFGRQLGLAFQFVDDLLGIWGDPASTGKPIHADLGRRKKSLPVVAALNSATAAGTELGVLYQREGAMTAVEMSTAAELVALAGGRAYAAEQADLVFAEAAAELSYAVGGDGADLTALAHLVVRRDR